MMRRNPTSPVRPAPQKVHVKRDQPDEGDENRRPKVQAIAIQVMSVPLFAGFVFGICGMAASASVSFTLRDFAEQGSVNHSIFVVVPGLFSMLYALFVFQNAEQRIKSVAQAISRGILVALLTWLSFSALATWVWCQPQDYLNCFSKALILAGLIGGGPMLGVALVAGGSLGWLIKQKRLSWIMD